MADTERGFTFSEDQFSTALAEALRYFEYGSLKVEQIECLRRVISLREDVLAVLPKGFGKSLIYQTRRLEALTWDALVDEWVHTITLVIRGK